MGRGACPATTFGRSEARPAADGAGVVLPPSPILDSNLRFFGGIWLGLGLAMLWLVPSIAQQGVLFRALLELVGSPLFIYWQYRIAQSLGTP
jgi:uncharacterized protein DUF4345